MDFTVIVQRLNELTTFMNNVRTLSKKIFELPNETAGNKLVAVWNETDEEPQKFDLTAALQGMYSLTNGLTAIGNIVRDGADFTFEIGFEWKINGIEYANEEITRTINDAGTGNHRIDIAVADTNNDIYIIEGFEVPLATAVVQPPTPPNTVFLCSFLITESVIGDNTSPETSGQNNIPLKVNILSTDLATNDIAGFVTYINELNPPLTVLEINSLVQYYLTDTNDIYQFVGIGKGVYGQDNLQITSSNVFKFNVANSTTRSIYKIDDADETYTTVLADRGKIIYIPTTATVFTELIVDNVYNVGDTILIYSEGGAQTISMSGSGALLPNYTPDFVIGAGELVSITLLETNGTDYYYTYSRMPYEINSEIYNLQQVTDEGNTITDGTYTLYLNPSSLEILYSDEQALLGFDSLLYADLTDNTRLSKTGIEILGVFGQMLLQNGYLEMNDGVDTVNYGLDKIIVNGVDYPLPTGASSPLATLADITGGSGGYTVVSSNTTAVNDTNYTVVANATFTDPSPTEGKGYVVYVRNGIATIGGTGYAVGSLVFRVFHSGGWSTRGYIDQTQIGSATQTALDQKDVLPVIYEKHANVPIFGNPTLNNLEGVAFVLAGATSRIFADTSAYTRRQRLGLTVAVTGNLGQARQSITYFNRNSSLDVIIGLGFAENCTNANVRAFAGVCSNTGPFSNVEPTALLNCIGIAKLTTSNNLHIIHNDGSGTATVIDLGASFPSNTIETDFYILRLKTNGSNIDYSVTRVNTGGVATGTLSTDLPNASTALNLGYYVVQNSGANTTTGIDYFGTNLIKS